MLFDLFRLSLLPSAQIDAFEPRSAAGGLVTREEWLRHVFAGNVEFMHRRKRFVFMPYADLNTGHVIAGGIGRKIRIREDVPTTKGYQPQDLEAWRSSIFLLDPTSHGDGQLAAIENIPEIGQPFAILMSLAAHLNRHKPPYIIEPGVISEPTDFWEWVAKHREEVTTATFDFIAPNMFGIRTDYDKEMKSLQEQERVEQASIKLKATQGLNLETGKVKQAVDYISRGTGFIRASTRRGAKFNSKDHVKHASTPEDEVGSPGVPLPIRQRIALAIRIVFGK